VGHQVTLQRLEFFAVFQTDDVIVVNGTLRIDRRLLLVRGRLFGAAADAAERCMHVGN
jgi:hypothetical protein